VSCFEMNRLFDILFASIVLVLFLPVGILISIFILMDDFGPVFFRQERIGKDLIPFYILKFRTMKVKQENKSLITVGSRDPRVTRVGLFLRKVKLDEFPQFINVLKGDMSVVGPRPEVNFYVKLYTQEQLNVLKVRPGITDRASLEYFEENRLLGESNDPEKMYIETIMPAKLDINLKFIPKAGILESIKVIFLTAKRVFFSSQKVVLF
jgi:lipopolysaccharide/colanic/teichoic acid biosynthesis glycosyltransferase